MSEKNIFLQELSEEINQLDIAGYLKQEMEELCKHMQYFKLKNVYDNKEMLKEHLLMLDHHNTRQIHSLEYDASKEVIESEHDIGFYASLTGREIIGEHKLRQKIREDQINLSYIMQAVRGFLLLTADEFCNASSTRMSIKKMLLERAKEEKRKKE